MAGDDQVTQGARASSASYSIGLISQETATCIYRQTSSMRRNLVGNELIDHSDGFNGLGKEHCKTRREWVKLWYFVSPIVEILR